MGRVGGKGGEGKGGGGEGGGKGRGEGGGSGKGEELKERRGEGRGGEGKGRGGEGREAEGVGIKGYGRWKGNGRQGREGGEGGGRVTLINKPILKSIGPKLAILSPKRNLPKSLKWQYLKTPFCPSVIHQKAYSTYIFQ